MFLGPYGLTCDNIWNIGVELKDVFMSVEMSKSSISSLSLAWGVLFQPQRSHLYTDRGYTLSQYRQTGLNTVTVLLRLQSSIVTVGHVIRTEPSPCQVSKLHEKAMRCSTCSGLTTGHIWQPGENQGCLFVFSAKMDNQ